MTEQHMGVVNDFRGAEVISGLPYFLSEVMLTHLPQEVLYRLKDLRKWRDVGEDGASTTRQGKMHRERLTSSNPPKSMIEAKNAISRKQHECVEGIGVPTSELLLT